MPRPIGRAIATLRVLGFKRRNILLSLCSNRLSCRYVAGFWVPAGPARSRISTGTANFNSLPKSRSIRITPALMAEAWRLLSLWALSGGCCRHSWPPVSRSCAHSVRSSKGVMDHISSELNKLRIDRSQRGDTRRPGRGKWIVAFLILALIGAGAAYSFLGRPKAVVVNTVKPRLESSSEAAVLVATGYVIAHHKIQVGSGRRARGMDRRRQGRSGCEGPGRGSPGGQRIPGTGRRAAGSCGIGAGQADGTGARIASGGSGSGTSRRRPRRGAAARMTRIKRIQNLVREERLPIRTSTRRGAVMRPRERGAGLNP